MGFNTSYKHLAQPIPFTGGLLLGRGFINDLYVHMGFHPAWKYRSVVEAELHDGHVALVSDRSVAMAELRERRSANREPPSDASEQEILEWIARSFSRRYHG